MATNKFFYNRRIMKDKPFDLQSSVQKTAQHTQLLLKRSVGVSEIDDLAIKQLCFQVFGERYTLAQKTLQNPSPITFEEFKVWLFSNPIDTGDVISYDCNDGSGKIIAIIRHVGINEVVAGATLYSDGTLLTSSVSLSSTGYEKASSEEASIIHRSLIDHGLEWNYEYSQPVERFVPMSGNYVKLTFRGGGQAMGVYDHTRGNEALMYCIYRDGGAVEYGLEVPVGLIEEIRFTPLDALSRRVLMDSLKQQGKVWNPYVKRIEDHDLRVQRGLPYYYINDRFYLIKVHDTHSTQDNRRYANGNYFKTKKEGMDALSSVIHAIKGYHAKPRQCGVTDEEDEDVEA